MKKKNLELRCSDASRIGRINSGEPLSQNCRVLHFLSETESDVVERKLDAFLFQFFKSSGDGVVSFTSRALFTCQNCLLTPFYNSCVGVLELQISVVKKST